MNLSLCGYVCCDVAQCDVDRGAHSRDQGGEGSLMAAYATRAPAGAERANRDQETQ